jgi:hypothetical protein
MDDAEVFRRLVLVEPAEAATTRGCASDPSELADEIAEAKSFAIGFPSIHESLESVSLTISVANRDLIVRALRALALTN